MRNRPKTGLKRVYADDNPTCFICCDRPANVKLIPCARVTFRAPASDCCPYATTTSVPVARAASTNVLCAIGNWNQVAALPSRRARGIPIAGIRRVTELLRRSSNPWRRLHHPAPCLISWGWKHSSQVSPVPCGWIICPLSSLYVPGMPNDQLVIIDAVRNTAHFIWAQDTAMSVETAFEHAFNSDCVCIHSHNPDTRNCGEYRGTRCPRIHPASNYPGRERRVFRPPGVS
jgi:hypothetical protein